MHRCKLTDFVDRWKSLPIEQCIEEDDGGFILCDKDFEIFKTVRFCPECGKKAPRQPE